MNRHTRAALGALALATLGACTPVEQLAPPPAAFGNTNPVVAQGRAIYLSNCTKCHGVKPVFGNPVDEWKSDILPTMCGKAKLDAAQRAAVEAYVLAVLKAGPSAIQPKP